MTARVATEEGSRKCLSQQLQQQEWREEEFLLLLTCLMCHLTLLLQGREAVVQHQPREAAKPSSGSACLSTFFSKNVLSLGVWSFATNDSPKLKKMLSFVSNWDDVIDWFINYPLSPSFDSTYCSQRDNQSQISQAEVWCAWLQGCCFRYRFQASNYSYETSKCFLQVVSFPPWLPKVFLFRWNGVLIHGAGVLSEQLVRPD